MKISSAVPHPIPYQGSKRALALEIISHFPISVTRLVEPFAGSAAISLATAKRGIASRFWINDAHAPLISLWDAIINRPKEISNQYRKLWDAQAGNERQFFNEVRDLFNAHKSAEHFLYLLARCVKAAIRYNSKGKFNNTPDNRRKGAHPNEMGFRITGASHLLKGKTRLTSHDYRDVLAKCGEDDLIYMDPPYQGVCYRRDNRYAPKVDHDEFWDQLQVLNDRGCKFIVSYDGRTGSKQHGLPMPERLKLRHLEICAGRSTQATLLGLDHVTYESLYLSPALVENTTQNKNGRRTNSRQMSLV